MTVKSLLTASALAGAALLIAPAATAQTGSIAPETGTYVNVGVDTFGFDAFGVSGKVGYNFNRFLGVEGQLGYGLIDSSEDDVIVPTDANGGFATGEVDEGYDLFGGAFAVGRVPVTPEVDLFGRIGYHFTQYDGEAESAEGDVDFGADFDGFAFGGGVQFNFGPQGMSGIRAEYTNFDIGNISEVEIDGVEFDVEDEDTDGFGSGDLWSLSYVRRF